VGQQQEVALATGLLAFQSEAMVEAMKSITMKSAKYNTSL